MRTRTSLLATIESGDITSLRLIPDPPYAGKIPQHVDAVSREPGSRSMTLRAIRRTGSLALHDRTSWAHVSSLPTKGVA